MDQIAKKLQMVSFSDMLVIKNIVSDIEIISNKALKKLSSTFVVSTGEFLSCPDCSRSLTKKF